MTDWSQIWQISAFIMVFLNVVVRTQWPSQYVPGVASSALWYSHPYLARSIATIAELYLYNTMALWCGKDFFGTKLGYLVIFGETVSWCGLLLQSEFVGWLEDSVWTVHSVYMAYLSVTYFQFAYFAVFSGYMILIHQPRMAMRIERPLIPPAEKRFKVIINVIDKDSRSWIVPMLFFFPMLQALMLYNINKYDKPKNRYIIFP